VTGHLVLMTGGFLLFLGVLLLLGIVLGVVVVVLVVGSAKGVGQWSRDNRAPLETSPATMVTKRSDVHRGADGATVRTAYYATFELRSGERLELAVSGRDYGQVAEGDRGQLTRQGSRFKAFARTPQDR
jgi:hypothetical protein